MPINNCYSLLMENQMIKSVLEAAILAAGEPVSLERLRDLFAEKATAGINRGLSASRYPFKTIGQWLLLSNRATT